MIDLNVAAKWAAENDANRGGAPLAWAAGAARAKAAAIEEHGEEAFDTAYSMHRDAEEVRIWLANNFAEPLYDWRAAL